MYWRIHFVSTSHMMLHAHTWLKSSWIVCPKHFLIPSVVSHHVSRSAQYTEHYVIFFTFLHFSIFLWLRLRVCHVLSTLRRFRRPWRWRFYGSRTSHTLYALSPRSSHVVMTRRSRHLQSRNGCEFPSHIFMFSSGDVETSMVFDAMTRA